MLAGEVLGTRFIPSVPRMRSYRRWLRLGAMVQGRVIVDRGAVQALREKKSLLPAGILRVEGHFQAGEVVEIHAESEGKLGVGVTDWGSVQLGGWLEAHRQGSNVSSVRPAIHRDRLLLV